ncbi:MAG: VanZ family protein [Rhodobacteraceae bacterium]|nr:VanZ family protein [Paracoccaceae bacterium]
MTKHPDTSQSHREFLRRHRFALLATGLLAAIIAWATLTPNPPTPELNRPLSDKFYHVMGFAGLVFPTALLYARSLIWILPLAVLFGVVIELVQPFFGREAEAGDVLADLIGLGMGTVIGLTLRAWLRRRS